MEAPSYFLENVEQRRRLEAAFVSQSDRLDHLVAPSRHVAWGITDRRVTAVSHTHTAPRRWLPNDRMRDLYPRSRPLLAAPRAFQFNARMR